MNTLIKMIKLIDIQHVMNKFKIKIFLTKEIGEDYLIVDNK